MKAVRSPPCAQCVFCVRAHRLREAIGRHVRRGRTCRYGGFASGGAAAAWRDMPPVQAPPAIAQRIFPEIREKMRGNSPFADCPPPLGFAFFSGARKPAGFSRRGAQVGENALQAFSERAAAAFRLRAFLSRDKDWSFRDGAGWGILRPILREISAERGADWENN